MEYKKLEKGYFLRVDRKERLIESILKFAEITRVPSGVLSAVGAVCNTKLGFYRLSSKTYEEITFPEEMELLNLTGNLSWLGEKPVVHCHATLGKPSFEVVGGHLFEAEIAVTVEIFLVEDATSVSRRWNEAMGLNLVDLGSP